MDDEFVLGDMNNDPPELELNEVRGGWVLVTIVSMGKASEGDPWGKNERWEAGTLRISGMVSKGLVDDDGSVPRTSEGTSTLSCFSLLALLTGTFSDFRR